MSSEKEKKTIVTLLNIENLVHTRFLKIGNTSMTLTMDCYKNIKSKDKLCVIGIIIRLIMDMNTDKLIKVTEFYSDIV